MKKYIFLSLIIFSLPFLFLGCGESAEIYSSYDITCSYDDTNHILYGNEKVNFINQTDNLLKEVCFHLYSNAFRENAKAKVVSKNNENKAYPNGKSYGKIDIKDVSITDQVCGYKIGGEDENILIVELLNGIYPDESVNIDITFEVTLPNINHRFGYGENTINFGNFYPIICRYENGKGFIQDLYHSNGDPFNSETANYSVKISYPENSMLASSGVQGKTSLEKEKRLKTTTVTANKVRDFAFVLSEKFTHLSQSVDGIVVNYYFYDDENPEKSLGVAVNAIKTFNSLFGMYPYKSVSVAKANFVHGGMEFPNLVLIADDITSSQDYEYVIVHELAHQWWYGVVGNNEYQNAWLDEGLTEYSTLLFYENNRDYGLEYSLMIKNVNKNYKHFVDIYSSVNGSVDTSMNRRLDEYETEPEYVNCTYTKGVLMFDTFRETIGEKKFYKALKNYYKKFMFKNVSVEEFIDTMSSSTGRNQENFFTSWIDGSVVVF